MAGGSEDRGVFPFSGTRAYFQEKIELPFFNHYLKGRGPVEIPEATVFETGTDQWRTYPAWPPAEAKDQKLFFADDGRLASGPGAGSPSKPGFDEYRQRPGQARALHHADDRPLQPGLFRRRPAVRRLPARCPGLYRRAARGRRDDRRTDQGRALRLDDGNGRRLGRQGDRRLSRRRARSQEQSRRTSAWAAISGSSAGTSSAASSATASRSPSRSSRAG